MSIEVAIDGVDSLNDFFGGIKDNLVNGKVLGRMADEASSRVLERTRSGKDVHGALFKPYSKSYQKARKKKGLQVRRVDLESTGEMLGDISATVYAADNMSTVSFNDSKNVLKAGFNQQGQAKREFFGLDEAGKEVVGRMLEEHIDEVIKDAY